MQLHKRYGTLEVKIQELIFKRGSLRRFVAIAGAPSTQGARYTEPRGAGYTIANLHYTPASNNL